MRVALAIAAMVAAPLTARADEPAPPPTSVPGIPGPGVNVPAPTTPPASTEPAPAPTGTEAPPDPDAPANDPAYGDTREFPAPRGKDVIITAYPERSKKNIIVLSSLAAGGVIMGAIGLYFHLDARSASDEISANNFTGEPWGPDKQETFDRAHTSSITAGVFYGIGGTLVLATAIAYIATEPKAETTVIHPHSSALVAPTNGGAIVGGAWSF